MRRQLPIFPCSCPHSIVGAEELNFRVRDGNGCALFAIVTSSPAQTGGFSLQGLYYSTSIALSRPFGKNFFGYTHAVFYLTLNMLSRYNKSSTGK